MLSFQGSGRIQKQIARGTSGAMSECLILAPPEMAIRNPGRVSRERLWRNHGKCLLFGVLAAAAKVLT